MLKIFIIQHFNGKIGDSKQYLITFIQKSIEKRLLCRKNISIKKKKLFVQMIQ